MDKRIDDSVAAYTSAVLRSDLAPLERRQAARDFQALAKRIVLGGEMLIDRVKQATTSEDGVTRYAAARLLASMPDPRAAVRLLDVFSHASTTRPESEILGYLGLAAPMPSEAWTRFPVAPSHERGPLARALLRKPSEDALRLLEEIVAAGDPASRDAVAAATWCDPALLRRIAGGPPRRNPDLPLWLAFDLRVEAAFQLGLRDEHDGIEHLERWAGGLEEGDVGNSLVRLGRLAWPGAVPLVSRALTGDDVGARELALDAASALRAAALVAPLLHLAARLDLPPSPYGISPTESALAIASKIVGAQEEPSPEDCRRRLAALDPAMRYHRGYPLSLSELATELESNHSGIKYAAAYNLRCITGKDFEFDPELDFIANLTAIDAWQQYVATAPGEPGSWLWRGQPLRPPPA